MPVGLIGYEFTQCWQDRTKVLLLARAQKRFAQWGYRGHDIQQLFDFADDDNDGALNLMEFCGLLCELRLGLSNENIVDLFEVFDQNADGLIEGAEFVETLFPITNLEETSTRTCDDGQVTVVQVATDGSDAKRSRGEHSRAESSRASVLTLPGIQE